METFTYGRLISDRYENEPRKLDDKIENLEVVGSWFKEEFSKDVIRDILDGLIDAEKREKTDGKVILSTIHAAKGLEWNNVFLACCNEKILPYYTDELSNVKKDSELRLFYVAVSRAKDNLQISYANKHDWKEFKGSGFLGIVGGFGGSEVGGGCGGGFVSGDEF
jgi:superfamily I DNA/RNA helicase